MSEYKSALSSVSGRGKEPDGFERFINEGAEAFGRERDAVAVEDEPVALALGAEAFAGLEE
jgi:hypothetical protein